MFLWLQNKVQDDLVRLQPGFKKELLHSVETFKTDVSDFGTNYDIVSLVTPTYLVKLTS